jgi:hypothetical protein
MPEFPGYAVTITTSAGDVAEIDSARPVPVLLLGSHANVRRALTRALTDLRTDQDSSPSDVAYDDMTRAWRNGDYPLAWSLADALLQYLANDGQPLTGDRDVSYARQIHSEALEDEGH